MKVGNLIVFGAHASTTQRLVSYDPTDILYHSNEGMHWSISPSLPEGLTLDSNTGKITGIPTEVIDWTDYTVTLTANDPYTYSYYDGTGNASLVKNIFTGFNEDGVSNQSYPTHMFDRKHYSIMQSYQSEVGILNGEYYFIAMDNDLCPDEGVCTNWEVFKTDGTEEGTAMVKAIRTGDGSANRPRAITAPYNGELYFKGSDGTHGDELWKTDGTEEGTVMVKNIANTSDTYNSNPYEFQHFNGYLYFTADSGNSCNEGGKGRELWRTDGTEEGTVIVLDINDECQNNNAGDANPHLLEVVGDYLFFGANDGENGTELWKSDGTAEGTSMVKDIWPGAGSGHASTGEFSSAVFKGEYYFTALSSNSVGQELWKSDGTEEGTVMVKDIWPTYQKSSSPYYFVTTTDYLYFIADDGVHGKELWRTDGTEEGTIMLETNDGEFGGMVNSAPGVEFGDYFYFSSCDNCDGGSDDGDLGVELWRTDGTAEGTSLFIEINPSFLFGDGAGGYPGSFLVVGDSLFFTAQNSSSNTQLYRTDGTVNGTSQVTNLPDATCVRQPNCKLFAGDLGPIFLNNKLLFSGYRYEDNSDGDTREDRELFAYDPQNITFGNVIKFTFDFKLQVLPSSPDSDGDGVRDDADLDDDNDGILDVDEVGPIPLDANNMSGETIRVGYKNGGTYNFASGYKEHLEWKLLNSNLFGPNGLYNVTFETVSFGSITENNLVANEIDIFYAGGNTNDGGYCTQNSHHSSTEKQELLNWSVRESDNFVIGFQGLITSYSDVAEGKAEGYCDGDSITNPMISTDEGENILIQPYTYPDFSQGGAYQGYFDLGSDASNFTVLMTDSHSTPRPVIVHHTETNDLLLADVDILSSLGGISGHDGITSENDKLFANIFLNLAHLVSNNAIGLTAFGPLDLDGDGIPSDLDDDSDGDGCSDILEAGFTDADGDGQLDGTGIDENGTVVGSDGYTTPADLDGDGTLDYLQSSFSPCRDLYPSVDDAEFAIGKTIDDITFQFGLFSESYVIEDPTWTAASISVGSANNANGVFVADMDGDGDMDIVSSSYNDDTIAWYENDGNADPTWTAADIATNAGGANGVFVADMDGDGDMDISYLLLALMTRLLGTRMMVMQILLGQLPILQRPQMVPTKSL